VSSPAIFKELSGPGPVTHRVAVRTFTVYGIIFLTGGALGLWAGVPWLKSLGLGLVLPGGGFLFWAAGSTFDVTIHAALALGTLFAFAASLALWFATGNAIVALALWLVSAMAAAAMNHHAYWQAAPVFVLALVIAILATAVALYIVVLRRGKAQRQHYNELIHQLSSAGPAPQHSLRARESVATTDFASSFTVASESGAAELSLESLGILRLILDRALQPLERFDGFDVIDQFQTSALRYQLNFAGYALSLFQHTHAPAFSAYLNDAQSNLILKNCDPRVWNYWRLENLWGNLDRNPDPMARDNVMFTGFVATQIAAFEAATGDRRFSGPEGLVFADEGGRRFAHCLPLMVETLMRNISSSRFSLIACEPNWIFPLCNSIAFAALCRHSPLEWQALAPRIAKAIDDEFLTTSGRFVACRSARLGLAIPALGGAAVQTLPCFFLNASLPDLAARHWLVERLGWREGRDAMRKCFWPIDTGNYRFSRASSYAATAAAAVEMGDVETAEALFSLLQTEYPAVLHQHAAHRPGVSFWAHSAELMARVGARDAFRKLMMEDCGNSQGPRISAAPYPAVIPLRAVAGQGRLDCVLYPGIQAGISEIGLSGLTPRGDYRWQGGIFQADSYGTARLTLRLEGRTNLTVLPVV
jgi:hypothetical protein